jgi:hypothetical protein
MYKNSSRHVLVYRSQPMSILWNKRLMLFGEVIVIRSENRTRHQLLALELRKRRYELYVVLWQNVDGRSVVTGCSNRPVVSLLSILLSGVTPVGLNPSPFAKETFLTL